MCDWNWSISHSLYSHKIARTFLQTFLCKINAWFIRPIMHESFRISNNSRLHLFTHNEMLSACMFVSKLDKWSSWSPPFWTVKYRVKRMLGTTTQYVTLWAVMATADRATCNTRAHAPLIDQAVGLYWSVVCLTTWWTWFLCPRVSASNLIQLLTF